MIDLFCPSRGRPDAAWEVRRSFDATSVTNEVTLSFCVDDDDPTLSQYPTPIIVGRSTGDPTGPLNAAALASRAEIVGFLGDDTRFETVGWDAQVIEAMKEPSFCWGDDGNQVPWPSTVFITRSITDALGYMVHPSLRRGFFDVQWVNLARLTRTERVIEAMFRHDNSAGDPKSPNFKPSHQVPPHVIASDEAAFNHWMKFQMKADAQRIRHAIYA